MIKYISHITRLANTHIIEYSGVGIYPPSFLSSSICAIIADTIVIVNRICHIRSVIVNAIIFIISLLFL